ncbi:unnamed protein product [Hermetia illucens]|uniref:Large ribosomal subunit protein uL30-like ferredoxin-like fold domain-containing protein n=1 Tax=Hermetia illucens TaxID=343691 RepID=A0A7R8UFE4_HERIL|nr:60S ribosomal protein L7-2 [Hermetia illucens]CAD7079587.1 unnamed protein product [Hermetia illucens]
MSDKYAVPNKLPAKQVAILAHRRRRILADKSKAIQKKIQRQKTFKKSRRNFKRAEAFIMDYIKKEKTQNRMRRTILKDDFLKNEEQGNEKLLLVMRHCGRRIADKTTNEILRSLRLSYIYKTVFLKNTPENRALLKLVEPYIAYGYPSNTTVRDIIFKHGFAMINGKKTLLSSNTVIEEHLGEHGIICLEDVIHEIVTVGPKFDLVVKFFCSFTLKVPSNGWRRKVSVPYSRGGEYGNRKHAINALIARCI